MNRHLLISWCISKRGVTGNDRFAAETLRTPDERSRKRVHVAKLSISTICRKIAKYWSDLMMPKFFRPSAWDRIVAQYSTDGRASVHGGRHNAAVQLPGRDQMRRPKPNAGVLAGFSNGVLLTHLLSAT